MSSFDAICRGEQGSLLAAALEFASDEYPELDIESYLRFVHHLCVEFSHVRGNEKQPEAVLRLLGDYFFGELEFTGNTEDYYDPRNSYLNDVIDRRVGIPISLSVLFQHLAARAGIRLVGVNFPGHFLLAYPREHDRIYIDVFQAGQWLDWQDCQQRLNQHEIQIEERDLGPMHPREILLRMLRNLKGIYSRRDMAKCLAVQKRIVQLSPRDADERRDLGILYLQAGKPMLAVRTLDSLVRDNPDLPQREVIMNYLSRANREVTLLN
jgi:regulator of sirC expression with transglutaminase-like and TPR domain